MWRAAAAATADPRWARPASGQDAPLGQAPSPEWQARWLSADRAAARSAAAPARSGPTPGSTAPGGTRPPEGSASPPPPWKSVWKPPWNASPRGAPPQNGPAGSTGTRDTGTPGTGTPDTGTPDTGTPPPDGEQAMRRRALAVVCPPMVVLAGGLAMIGSMMTWATVRAYGYLEFAVRGTDPDQSGQLTLALGVLTTCAGLLLPGRRALWGRMLAVLTGLLLALTAVVELARLDRGDVLTAARLDGTVAVGPGLWLVLVGGALAFAAAVLAPGPTRSAHDLPAPGGPPPGGPGRGGPGERPR